MSNVYENTKKLGETFKVDNFELYLVNEIDKVDEEMSKLEPYNYKYKELQIRRDTLKEIREKYHNLQK